MKKIIILACMLCGLPSLVMGQLKVDTLGRAYIGKASVFSWKAQPARLNLDSTGLAITGKYSFPPVLNLYTKNNVSYITRNKPNYNSDGLPGNIRMKNNTVQIYTSFCKESDLSDLLITAPLQAITTSGTALYVKGGSPAKTTPGFISKTTGAITIDVARAKNSHASLASCEVDSLGNRAATFFVKGDGTIYTQNGVIQSSDLSKKENVDSISPQVALDALTSLRGVSFSYKGDAQSLPQPVASPLRAERALALYDSTFTAEEPEEEYDESDRISDEVLARMDAERGRKRIGLIAQEVEKVIPEVVRTLPDGSKGIMYSDLIGMIIEGMKEIQTSVKEQSATLNARIDSLQHTVDFYKSLVPVVGPSADSIPSTPKERSQRTEGIVTSLTNQVVLYQNVPNPFTATTEIVYTILEDFSNCTICLYDLNGQILKQYALASNAGKVTIQGSELDSGTYIYTLTRGGQVLASRKMVKS